MNSKMMMATNVSSCMYLRLNLPVQLDISRCEALYDYEGQQGDELSISPGDSIYVTEKIDDDWWQGNHNGTIGIFPANYVEEVEVYN